MVEVFKTNVEHPAHAQKLMQKLREHFPAGRINFDLQDCDRILRVEDERICTEKIIHLLNTDGFHAELLV